MTSLRTLAVSTALGVSVFATGAMAQDMENPMVGGAEMSPQMNIVENASNSVDHEYLVSLVQQAGLVDTLSSEGPFTVFAPVDDAFDALPEGTIDTLTMEENQQMLVDVLTCHVIDGSVMASDIIGMVEDDGGSHMVETLGPCTLEITTEGGDVMITDENGTTATVTTADVVQSNGVIHVTDAVFTPAMGDSMASDDMASGDSMSSDSMSSDSMASEDMSGGDMENPMVGGAAMSPQMNIVENASNSADHEYLVSLVEQAGLVDTLSGEGPFTVFAPVDDAFDALPEGTIDTLTMEENQQMLADVLTCHVVDGAVMSNALVGMIEDDGGMHEIQTLGPCTLQASMENGNVVITDENGTEATVTIADVVQSNGVIHVTDAVFTPAQ